MRLDRLVVRSVGAAAAIVLVCLEYILETLYCMQNVALHPIMVRLKPPATTIGYYCVDQAEQYSMPLSVSLPGLES